MAKTEFYDDWRTRLRSIKEPVTAVQIRDALCPMSLPHENHPTDVMVRLRNSGVKFNIDGRTRRPERESGPLYRKLYRIAHVPEPHVRRKAMAAHG